MDYSLLGSSVHGISQDTEVNCHFLLPKIFPTQGWNPLFSRIPGGFLIAEPLGKSQDILGIFLYIKNLLALIWYILFWTVVLEKTLESPLNCKEIQPVHPKGDYSWVFIWGADVEAETPILWPLDAESWLIWTDPDAGKDWGQEEKGMTEDEMVGWHHRHNRHGFGWTPGVGDGQGGLACCGSQGCKELDTTEWLNWTELTIFTTSSPGIDFI